MLWKLLKLSLYAGVTAYGVARWSAPAGGWTWCGGCSRRTMRWHRRVAPRPGAGVWRRLET